MPGTYWKAMALVVGKFLDCRSQQGWKAPRRLGNSNRCLTPCLGGWGEEEGHRPTALQPPVPEAHCYFSGGSYWAGLSQGSMPLPLPDTPGLGPNRPDLPLRPRALWPMERTWSLCSASPYLQGCPAEAADCVGSHLAPWAGLPGWAQAVASPPGPVAVEPWRAQQRPQTSPGLGVRFVCCFSGVCSWGWFCNLWASVSCLENGNSVAHLRGIED